MKEQADKAVAISLENDLEESEAIAPPPAAVQVIKTDIHI